MNFKKVLSVALVSALALTACKDDKKASETNTENVEAKSDNETTENVNSGEATTSGNLLNDVALLNKAEKELKELESEYIRLLAIQKSCKSLLSTYKTLTGISSETELFDYVLRHDGSLPPHLLPYQSEFDTLVSRFNNI